VTQRRRHLQKASRGAFTLIELVVALAIVGILVGTLATSMFVSFRAKSSAEAAVEPGRTAGIAMELLREDLQNAVPPPPSSTNTSTGTTLTTGTTAAATTTVTLAGPFEGVDSQGNAGSDADDLVFYSTSNGPQHENGNGEIKMIELTILTPPGTSDRVLVRRVTSNLLSTDTTAPTADNEVICRGVAGFNLRYYDGTQWQDSWDSTQLSDELPTAVEVTLTLDRPGNSGKPRLLKYVRVFPLSCSSLLADQAAQNSSTTGTSTTGTSKTGATP
jgi:prepilin-type N-terminal cleavage/methylation domain-containing protein